jgi:uncharacterized protein (DUF2235 family)
MPRNIVICCDGAANEFAQARTNVVKLYYALEHDRPDQIAFYHPGLGTMEPPGALTTPARKVTRLMGKALGYRIQGLLLRRLSQTQENHASRPLAIEWRAVRAP